MTLRINHNYHHRRHRRRLMCLNSLSLYVCVFNLFNDGFSAGYFRLIRGCIQKFPDWPPGTRTASGTALCH
jgi:hypothetical protein